MRHGRADRARRHGSGTKAQVIERKKISSHALVHAIGRVRGHSAGLRRSEWIRRRPGKSSPEILRHWIRALTLSPLELAAQHVEEGAFSVQELDLILRFAAEDAVAVEHGHAGLAINAQVGFFLAGHDDDFNL